VEKLIYLLWKPDTQSDREWHRQLSSITIPELRVNGAQRFRLNLVDDDVAGAAGMRMTDQPPLPDAMLSFWLTSAHHRLPFESILTATSKKISGYSVCESEPLPNTLHPTTGGERCYGMNHVVFLQIPPRLNRNEWLNIWLDRHTQEAIETQQNFGYRQNIVIRSLTADAPLVDAIVEENFPPAAIVDQNAFYRNDSPQELAANQKRMIQSCVRFIDFDKMSRLPTSEFNFP
jgi:hypothetical protein